MKKYIIVLLMSALWFTGCTVDDLLEDPNNPGLEDVDPDLLLTGIQENLSDFFAGMSQDGMNATRMINTFPRGGTYETFYQPQDFDEDWEDAYSDILLDISNLIPITEEIGFDTHTAIAKLVRAYVLVTLVDYFGDVPYSEAFGGLANLNPKLDAGADVYNTAYDNVLSAIEDLNASEVALPVNDIFFDASVANYEDIYKELAYSMLLKIDLQRRLVDDGAMGRIQDLIDTASFLSVDWKFDFSTNIINPDSRHSYFGANYDNGASVYMANAFMTRLIEGKSFSDPRLRYYFYRQETTITTDPNDLPCISESKPAHYSDDDVFCNSGNGYWGRDHINNDGIPPDTGDRTVYGLYPVGGRMDLNDDEAVNQTTRSGAGGAGFHPLIMRHFVDFMLAEYYLVNSDEATARTFLEDGMNKAFADVRSFANSSAEAARAQAVSTDAEYSAAVATYVAEVLGNYDAADASGKLNIVMTEYLISAFGNGIEPFNGYRRTGFPNDMQPALNPTPGPFFRSFPYPSVVINRNSNIGTKGSVSVKVFWDNNPDDFIN